MENREDQDFNVLKLDAEDEISNQGYNQVIPQWYNIS